MTTLAPDRPLVAGDAAGYSMVRAADVADHGGCSLVVESPDRVRTRLHIGCHPDSEAAQRLVADGLRPLAVRIDLCGSEVGGCSTLCASADGPQRRPIPLATALALCADGCHTIVTRER